jgi:LysM repeat protein
MSYSDAPSYVKNAPVYFHRVREGETTPQIAARYNVSATHLMSDPAAIQPKTGDIMVVDTGHNKLDLA